MDHRSPATGGTDASGITRSAYETLAAAVRKRARRHVPSELAEDVTVDVLEVFCRRYGDQYSEMQADAVAKVLNRITTYKLKETYRRVRQSRLPGTSAEHCPWVALTQPAVPGSDAHLTFLAVWERVDELGEPDHTTVVMAAWSFTYAEIAECTGQSVGQVRNRLYAVRERLRNEMGDDA